MSIWSNFNGQNASGFDIYQSVQGVNGVSYPWDWGFSFTFYGAYGMCQTISQNYSYTINGPCAPPFGETTDFEGWIAEPPNYGGLFSATLDTVIVFPGWSYQGRHIKESLLVTDGDTCKQIYQGPWEFILPPEGDPWTVGSDNRYATWDMYPPGPDFVAAYYNWIDYYVNHASSTCHSWWQQNLKISSCMSGGPLELYLPYASHTIGVAVTPLYNYPYQVKRANETQNHPWPW
jgi:hypothetical protein